MSDNESAWVKTWLASASVVLVLQIGAMLWFLATQAEGQATIQRTIARIEPQHNEVYYFYKQVLLRSHENDMRELQQQ